jgi:hypothetical protein
MRGLEGLGWVRFPQGPGIAREDAIRPVRKRPTCPADLGLADGWRHTAHGQHQDTSIRYREGKEIRAAGVGPLQPAGLGCHPLLVGLTWLSGAVDKHLASRIPRSGPRKIAFPFHRHHPQSPFPTLGHAQGANLGRRRYEPCPVEGANL